MLMVDLGEEGGAGVNSGEAAFFREIWPSWVVPAGAGPTGKEGKTFLQMVENVPS
jgi:hypothetical protein